MSHRVVAAAVIVSLTLGVSLPAAAKERGPRLGDLVLNRGFAPLSPADLALTSVPFAPGARSVVLLEAVQYEWADEYWLVEYQRRVKVLTDAGVQEDSDFSETLYGDWRIKEVQARTILPDGTIIDASSDVHQEASKDDEVQEVRITFPKVQPGAILDLRMSYAADAVARQPWYVQEDIPVLDSRYILAPPPGYEYRSLVLHLPAESAQPVSGPRKQGMAFAWAFRDQPPLPDLPHVPPVRDIAAQLLIVPVVFGSSAWRVDLASGWGPFGRQGFDAWRTWLDSRNGKAAALAATIAPGETDPLKLADAVRLAVQARVRSLRRSVHAMRDHPDQVLDKGSGTSADVAGLCVAMLRSRGVAASLAAIRHRDSGSLSSEVAVPSLLNDLLVSLPGAGANGGPLYFSATAEETVGKLPWHCTQIFAIPYEKKAMGAVEIPGLPASADRIERKLTLELDPDGNARGQLSQTCHELAAARWRSTFAGLTEDERRSEYQDTLREQAPSAVVTSLKVTGAEDGATGPVAFEAELEISGFAARAGERLVFSPFAVERVDAGDWAPETRTVPVEFGNAFEVTDEVTVSMPPGTTGASLPKSNTMNAGAVGLYETTYAGAGKKLTSLRRLRMDSHLFASEQYPTLRKWYLDMAAADEQAIVLTMAP